MIQGSLEDFRRSFKGCFVNLTTNNEVITAQYTKDNDREFSFNTLKYGGIIIDEESARKLITIPFPEFGLYNSNKDAVLFHRVPNRQWKRTIHEDNCGLMLITNWEIKEPLELSLQSVNYLLNPWYPENLEAAIKMKRDSIAINKDIAIIKTEQKTIQLNWKRRVIGTLNPEEKVITLVDEPMHQEIKDYTREKDKEWLIETKFA